MCLPRYNTGAHLRECWNGRQARLRCVWSTPCGFESHLSHQKEHHPYGWCSFCFIRVMGLKRPLRKYAGGILLGRGRALLPTDASHRDADGSGKHNAYPISDFSTAFPFCLFADLSCIFSVFLKVLEGSYIILILFATIFYANYSFFTTFSFCKFRHKTLFSNFCEYVMHTIHKFFHRTGMENPLQNRGFAGGLQGYPQMCV